MAAPVELIPLVCARCQNPVEAQVDEVAWVCGQCGQGLLLSDDKGTVPVEIHFASGLDPLKKSRPFWVARGSVEMQRSIYGGGDRSREADQFWGTGRTFFVPAFTCPLEEAVQHGMKMLTVKIDLMEGAAAAPGAGDAGGNAFQPGRAAPFLPVTVLPEYMQAYADFIVMAVEAGRGDKLKELKFSLRLDAPELWVIA